MSNERNHEIVQKKTLLMILNKDLVKILFVSLLSKTDISKHSLFLLRLPAYFLPSRTYT